MTYCISSGRGAFLEGVEAHLSGLEYGENPYCPGLQRDEYEEWQDGWLDSEHANTLLDAVAKLGYN